MIHLDAKTGHSFLRGFGNPEAWYERAKDLGATAFGLADYCSTWGHIPFRSVFKDIKLLYGVQVPVVVSLDKDPRHGIVTLIAKSDDGLKQLYEIMALAHEQMYYRPRLTWKQLGDLTDIEIIVNECSLGDLIDFKRLDKGFLGVRPVASHMHRVIDEFPCVAIGSPVYPTFNDREGYELVQAISSGHRIGEVDGGGVHMMTEGEYVETLRGLGVASKKKWFVNASNIAEECNASINQASLVLAPGDLRAMARAGAKQRNISLDGSYGDRLEHEIKVIEGKQFSDYFVFVAELVAWAKERMLVGPARGSAGGSLLCYLLGITNVDPLVYGTLFERFLDPTRSDYPDIDVDFPDDKRELVFEHLTEKYGSAHVARLGTISKLGGKSAVNDVAKAYGIPFAVSRDINNAYDGLECGLGQFFKNGLLDELKPLIETHPNILKSILLEGVPRHTGVHAAGVCVTKEPVKNFGVVNENGTISLDMHDAERIGMLKMDALGLRTLSVLADACKEIGMDYNKLNDLSFDDAAVFAVFNRDLVTGVFQFDGRAVRSLMKQMKVETFDDLCALTSLARPGPLGGGAAGTYVQRRAALVDWDYAHPSLRKHTQETYGTIVYQEQAMAIVADLGDFEATEVNAFRKAVGKKDPVALASFEEKFVVNATEVFGNKTIAEDLWDEMCEFGSYAFNKSHAVAYSMISYMCAWLKANHPREFAVAHLRNAMDDEQGKALLRELERDGHKFVAFDVERSEAEWYIDGKTLIGGFTSVKGIGIKTARKMVRTREKVGDGWMDELTESQRTKILTDFNTPWHDLSRFGQSYAELYDNPLGYRSKALPLGAKGPIYRIHDIPDQIGTYTFLARLTRRQLRTKVNDKGEPIGEFCNLYFEDDTGTVGCTISRYKWENFDWLMEDNYDGTDWIVKGDIINDGRVWLFLNQMIQLGEDDKRNV